MSQSPGCLDEDRAAMLQAALPVRRAAFRLLLRGQPASINAVATVTGLSNPSLRRAVDNVASVGMAERMDDTVIGMDGLSTRPTQHGVMLDGVQLWTWCAYDIVGIAAALGIDAQGCTRCGHCDQPLEVEVRAGEPKGTIIVGWLPSEACSNVMAEFCPPCSSARPSICVMGFRTRTDAGAKPWV